MFNVFNSIVNSTFSVFLRIFNVTHTPHRCLLQPSFVSSYCIKLVFTFLHVSANYCSNHQGAIIQDVPKRALQL